MQKAVYPLKDPKIHKKACFSDYGVMTGLIQDSQVRLDSEPQSRYWSNKMRLWCFALNNIYCHHKNCRPEMLKLQFLSTQKKWECNFKKGLVTQPCGYFGSESAAMGTWHLAFTFWYHPNHLSSCLSFHISTLTASKLNTFFHAISMLAALAYKP